MPLEPFLNKISDCHARGGRKKPWRGGGKKERGRGEGFFARPRFPPQPNFVPTKLARRKIIYFKFRLVFKLVKYTSSNLIISEHLIPLKRICSNAPFGNMGKDEYFSLSSSKNLRLES